MNSYEQPIQANDLEVLQQLVRETGADIMADECLHDAESLDSFTNLKECPAVNVRISKCGGLVAARERCRQAAAAGLGVTVNREVLKRCSRNPVTLK